MNRNTKKKEHENQLSGHVKLEPRRLLNADFNFAGALTLDNFVNSDAGADLVTVSNTGTSYSFVLSDGVWNGDDTAADITGDGTNTLLIDNSLGSLTSIFLNSETADQFDIEFSDFDFNGGLDIANDGVNPLFGNVTQQAGTSMTLTGLAPLNISGAETIDLQEATNDFTIVSITDATQVDLTDSNGITLTALEATSNANVAAGGTVNVASVVVAGDLDISTSVGDIIDFGPVEVGGTAQFTATTGAIALDELDVTGSIGLESGTNSTIVNTTSVDLLASTVGSDLDVTATTGDITDSGTIIVGATAQFDAIAGSITLDQLDVTGSIGLDSATTSTIVNTTAVDLSAATVGTDLDVTATTGDVTDSGTVTVGGMAQFSAPAGAIDLNELDVTGSIGLTSLTTATITNTTAVDLKASTVGTDLDVTATTGDVTDSATVTVGGMAQFNAPAGAIDLDQLDVTGSIGLASLTSATITNTTAVDLKASTVGTDLDVTATTGDVTDSATVTVGGMAQFNAPAGAIDLDQLDVTGSIGLASLTSATIINTTAVDLKASTVGTDLDVTATTGDVTDSATVTVGGMAQFNAPAGAIDLDQLDVTGSIGLASLTTATITNTTAVDLKASTVGTDLDVTATTGDVTDSATVTVGGMAQFNAPAGAIDLDQLDVTGSIGLASLTTATITNTTAVDLKASTVGTDLDVTATTGDVTDSATVTVGGMAQFNAPAGAIDLDQLDVTGSIGLASLTTATITNTTAVDLKASTVGTDLDVTATTGDVTDSATVTVGGMAQFNAPAGAIDLDQLDVTGSIGLASLTTATITNTTAVDLKASTVGTDLDVTATTGDVTDGASVTVGGMAQFNAPAGAIDLDQLAVTGMIGLASAASATIVNTTGIDFKTSVVGGNLSATASTGNITQTGGSLTVTGTSFFSTAAGTICLTDATNDFVGEVSGIGTTVEFVDRNAMSVGDITAVDDIYLRSGATESGVLTLNGDLTTTALTGQILLQSDTGVAQAAGVITTGQLLLGGDLADEGSGDFDLTQTNNVQQISANLQGDLNFVNLGTLDVADLSYASICGTSEAICGLNIGGNLDLNVGGNLTQTAAIIVQGTTNLVATLTICLTGGDCTGDGLNDNDFVGAISANATTVEIVDANALVVADIVAVDDIFLRSGDNGVGALSINGDLTTTAVTGQVLLQSDSGAVQAATSTITTNDLLVGGNLADEGSGVFDLVGSNAVNNLAANITSADGELDFINTLPVIVGNLAYSSSCGTTEAIVGLNATTKVHLSADGVAIEQQITSATVFIESSSGVTQGAAGQIITNDLMLSGTGLFDLSNPLNDTDNIAAAITGILNYIDADDVTIARLTCDATTICGLTISGDLNITTNGDLFQDADAAVIVGGNTVIDAGAGNVCLTGGDCDGDGFDDNSFGGTLTVSSTGEVVISDSDAVMSIDGVSGGGSYRFIGNNIQINTAIAGTQLLLEAANGVDYNGNLIDVTNLMLSGAGVFDFGTTGETANSIDNLAANIDGSLNLINATNVDIADLLFTSACGDVAICGVNIAAVGGSGDFDLILVDADLTQSASILVAGATTIDAGTGTICLNGGDCTGDGLNDNDFVGEVNAIGATVEIVDANDLLAGEITATDDIFLRAGDNGTGALTLNGDLTTTAATGQVLLQSDSGVSQTIGIITTNELLLGGDLADEGSGNFALEQANAVNVLAADLENELSFVNSTSFEVGSVSYTSACGTLEAAVGLDVVDKVRLSADGLTINQQITSAFVFLESTNGATQGAAGQIITTDLMVSGAGNFVLTNPANDTDNLAALVTGNLNYVDVDNVTIAELTCDGVTLTGVNVTGNLDVTTNGDLDQNAGAPVIVSGTTTLNSGAATICLTDATNDFVGQVAANGATVELVDRNDLIVGDVFATDDIFLRSGATDTGALLLNGDLSTAAVNGQILLQSDSGVTKSAASGIVTTELLLGGDLADEGSGAFNLTTGLLVNRLSANLQNDLILENTLSLEIADLNYSSACGTIEAICGLNIGGNLDLTIVGGLTQSASIIVQGTTDIDATQEVCLTGGDCTGDGLNDNDFVGVVNAAGTTVEIVDSNALIVGNVVADTDIFLRSGDNGVGALTISGNLTTIGLAGQTLLQSDSGVVQAAASVITTDQLLMGGDLVDEGTGVFNLVGANVVNQIASNIVGELNFINTVNATVANLSYVSICGTNEVIAGLNATDKIRLSGDGLTINEQVTSAFVFLESTNGATQGAAGEIITTDLMVSGTGSFFLTNAANDTDNFAALVTGNLNYVDVDDVTIAELTCDGVTLTGVGVTGNLDVTTNGDLDQNADAPVIVSGTTTLDSGTGTICLTNATNDFVGEVNAMGTTVELVDANDLIVGTINGVDDIFLRSGATATGSITINGDLVNSGAVSQILLQSDSGVTASAASSIVATDLILGGDLADEGSGTFDLTAGLLIDRLSANLQNDLILNNTLSLEIADLNYVSACGTTEAICGLNIGGNLDLTIVGALTQTASIVVQGTTDIDATQEVCLTGGDCTGDGLNDNDFVGEVNAAGTTVEIVDSNALVVGNVTADADIFLRSGDNGVGALTINGNLTTIALAGQTLLQSDSGVTQAATSVITTNQLILGGDLADEGTGVFDLVGPNVVDNIAATIIGELNFVNTVSATVGDLNYVSVCGTNEAIAGLSATDKIRLTVDGLVINEEIASAFVFIESTNGASQGANGQIITTDLMLSGTGVFLLSNAANDTDNLAAAITGTLTYFDVDEVTIASLTCDATTICGLNITNNLNLITNNGDIFQDADAAVIVGGNALFNTGTGDICLTGGDCDGDGSNDNSFAGTLTLITTGDVVIAENDDISIDGILGGGSLRFIGNNIQINTAITANQLFLEASNGVDYNGNVIDVTDLFLVGQGLFDFGVAGDTPNSIDNLAADIDGSLVLINSTDVNIGDLLFTSDCGDVALCGVNIDAGAGLAGDLELRVVDADITQTAGVTVEGNTILAAGLGDICLTFGDCDGDGINDNDFNTIVIESGDDVEIVDRNALTVTSATVTSQLRFFAGEVDPATLTLAGDITAGEQVLLQASDGVNQTGGIITTSDLILGSSTDANARGGDFTFIGANAVTNLVGQLDGDLNYSNASSLNIGDVTYLSDCGTTEAICGLNVAGNLVMALDADLTQTGSVQVTGATTIDAGGSICLTGADCANLPGIGNDNDFVGAVNATGSTVELVDINDLIVENITATDGIRLEAGNGDGDGDVSGAIDGTEILQSGVLTINGTVATTAADGQILLQSDGGIEQAATSVIRTNDLLLQTTTEATSLGGDFNLVGLNEVNRLAGDIGLDGQSLADSIAADNFADTALTFNNTISLEIADLVYDSVCGTNVEICGLSVDGELTMTVTGSLTQTASVRVTGVTDLTASEIICLTGGDCASLPGVGNDNDFVGTVTATANTVELVDINNLVVGDITAVDDIRLESGDGNGDADSSGAIDGTEVLQSGVLQIDGNLTTTAANGQVLLQSDGGIEQAAASVITTNDLLLDNTAEETSLGGDFNLIGANVVNRISGDIGFDGQSIDDAAGGLDFFGDVSLNFNNAVDLEVADLTYASACGTNVAICGLDVDGNLNLNVDGDLTQSASVRVTGTSAIDATGVICLTGGDCADLPGLGNDNDFVGEVTATATTVELVDINELIVGDINAVDDIRLESGNGNGDDNANDVIDGAEVLQSGDLVINGNLTTSAADGQVLLQSDADILQAAASAITTNDLLLQTNSESTSLLGNFDLIGANVVNRISGDIGLDGQSLSNAASADAIGDYNLTFNNTVDLEVAELTYDSACGTNVAICGLDVDGNLILTVDGDLTQTASVRVTGTSAIDATGVICLTGGDCADLPGVGNDNDFIGSVSASANTVELVDINDLIIGDITAVDDVRLEAGNGNGDADLSGLIDGTEILQSGVLTLNGNVTTSAADGQVLLQSDGGIEQAAASVITANDLVLQTTTDATSVLGDFSLIGANAVNRLAGDVAMDGQTLADAVAADNFGDVALAFNNTIDLEIADLTYDSVCGTTVEICGLDVDGELDILIAGDLTQDASIRVTGDSFFEGTRICLTGGDCADLPGVGNDNDFVGAVGASGVTVELVDINDLTVGTLGIVATDDVYLRAGDGETGTLTINGDLTTTGGQVLLQSDTAINQLNTSVITATDLLVGSETIADVLTGVTNLVGSNEVANLAVRSDASFTMENGIDLNIGELTYDSSCGTTETICGIDLRGTADLTLTLTDASLTQTAAVVVAGNASLTASDGTICLTGGECSDLLSVGNDNDFMGTVTANAIVVEIVDINSLTVGDITGSDDIRLEAGNGNGDLNANDAIEGTEVLQSGVLTINGNLTTAGGQILLQSDGGIEQATTSVISTNELLLQTTTDATSLSGDFNLVGANLINRLAGDIGLDGQTFDVAQTAADTFGDVALTINNNTNMQIANVAYSSTCLTNVAVAGLSVDGNWIATVDGNLTQDVASPVQITGTTTLDATGNIVLLGDGDDPLADGNANDFVGVINANTDGTIVDGNFVELADVNNMIVENVNSNQGVHLFSATDPGAAVTDRLELTGIITSDAVLLQTGRGVTQTDTAAIVANEMVLGGELAAEGTGDFNLVGVNQVSNVAADLRNGTMQFNNTTDLIVSAGLDYTGADGAISQSASGLTAAGVGVVLSFDDPNVALTNTIQGITGNDGQRFNPIFDMYLDTVDVGIAIKNAGTLTTLAGADVLATQSDVYLESTGVNALTIGDGVTVLDSTNRILTVAGGELVFGPLGRFQRGLAGADGLVLDELNDLILENPGTLSDINATVDATLLNQKLQFIYGLPLFGEQNHVTTIFWGIEGVEDNTFDLASLTQADVVRLTNLLFDGSPQFESRSFYDIDPVGTFDGITDGVSDEVLSQPINNLFNNSGKSPDSAAATAAFRLDFLRDNPQFRNVQFLFNDANINIFQNAATNLEDLNVATADFEGLARIGEPPVLVVDRPEFQIPVRVEITPAIEAEFFETIVVDEQPLFVQTVSEKFIVVVYFESQFEADQFEIDFEKLGLDEGDQEGGEEDYEVIKEKLIEALGLKVLEWDTNDEGSALDVNRIREILEQAGLELDDSEDSDAWLAKYKEWLNNQTEASEENAPPELPRGVYKIIEVENGKAVIQGDDVDRRFVPEPDDERGFDDYQFDQKPVEDNDTSSNTVPTSNRLARWSAMLDNDISLLSESGIADNDSILPLVEQAVAGTGVGLLAMLCNRNSKNKKTVQDEIESLGEVKAENPERNIFSRSARFKRRNEFNVRKQQK